MEDSTGNGNSQNNVHRAAILLIRALETSLRPTPPVSNANIASELVSGSTTPTTPTTSSGNPPAFTSSTSSFRLQALAHSLASASSSSSSSNTRGNNTTTINITTNSNSNSNRELDSNGNRRTTQSIRDEINSLEELLRRSEEGNNRTGQSLRPRNSQYIDDSTLVFQADLDLEESENEEEENDEGWESDRERSSKRPSTTRKSFDRNGESSSEELDLDEWELQLQSLKLDKNGDKLKLVDQVFISKAHRDALDLENLGNQIRRRQLIEERSAR